MKRQLVLLMVALFALASDSREGFSQDFPQRRDGDQRREEIRVTQFDSKYEVVKGGADGRFRTGQDADIVLGAKGFNRTGGPLLFNHPTGLATEGRSLLMTDRWNNRVLVWKNAPISNEPPDLVLGQPDFESNNPGTGRDQLNWPGNVAITPDGRIAVTDTHNDRVLIWNSFPNRNGAAADIELQLMRLAPRDTGEPQRSGPGRPMQRFGWPWGVWTDGKKFAVVATHGAAVLIWNSVPTRDDQPPDLILRPRDAGTPRNVTSDGTFFAVSDHNNGEQSRPATMVWRTFPTSATQEPDFAWREWLKGTFTADGKLIAAGMRTIYLWNTPPRDTEADADVVLRPSAYRNGDGPDVVVAGGRLYACNYNGNNVLGWNALPTRDHQPPDFSIGSDTPEQDTLAENFFITNPVLATDGQSLFVSSDFARKLFVWRQLPNENSAKPDLMYSLPEGAWDNALFGQTLVLAGKRTVYVWKKLPLHGEQPDIVLHDRIGSVELREITGVALDDRHLYLGDRQAGRIYVWDGIPTRDSEPKFTLDMDRCGRLSSDGKYLAAAPFDAATISVWRVAELSRDAQRIRFGGRGQFSLPGKCVVSHGHLFVADTSFHRVHVWDRIEDALAGEPADALLGARDEFDRDPGIGRNSLFMPGTVAFDGSRLWIGEFKFSSRLLRFSPQPEGQRVAQALPLRNSAPPAGRTGPWDQDILVYRAAPNGTSEKLATFSRAGVSTIARLRDDRLIVAHQHFPEDNTADFDKVAVRFSTDEGRTWSAPEVIRLTGLPEGMRFPFDPTLVPLPDGRVRMYFTSLKQWRLSEDRPEIHSAISNNGLDFAFEPGVRFGIAGRPVIDCAVVRHGETFHLFAPDNGPVGQPGVPIGERASEGSGYHATSSDGLTFERQRDVRIEGRRHWLGNALSDGESFRFIGTGGPSGVWMARSADGQSWTLDRDFPSVPGADPGAVKLKDGSWLVTVTGPPRAGTPSDRLRRQPQRSPPENKP